MLKWGGYLTALVGPEMYSRMSFGSHIKSVKENKRTNQVSIPAAAALPFEHNGWSC